MVVIYPFCCCYCCSINIPDYQTIHQKEAMKSFIALAGIVILVLIAYSMSDGTIMDIPGYSGSDNVPGTLKFTDTILITTYFLGIGAIGAIIVTEIIRRVR